MKNKIESTDDGESITIMRAVREMNQLILSFDNDMDLIRRACELLTSIRGYQSAWITLVHDDGSFKGFASSGMKDESGLFNSVLEQGYMPDCIKCLDTGIETYQVRRRKNNCGDCQLRNSYPGNEILTTRIRFRDKHYGYLTVATQTSQAVDHQETDFFTDISEILGLAINNFNLLKQTENADPDVVRVRVDWEKTFNTIPDLIAIINPDHTIEMVNDTMAKKLGCPAQEIIGKHCFEIVHGLKAIPEECPHSKSLVTGMEESSEVNDEKLGGIFDVTTTPLFDSEGTLAGSLHVARDITRRNKREKLMIENATLGEFALNHTLNELLTMIIDKTELLTRSQIGYFHFLEDDEITISQYAWSTKTSKRFCMDERMVKLFQADQAEVWAECVRERRPVIHNNFANPVQLKGMPKGHVTITRELTVPVFRGDKVVAVLCVGNKPVDYDVNDIEIVSQLTNLSWDYIVSKRFEEALRKSEQYARALLDAIPDLIFRMNRNGLYLDYKAMKEDLYYQVTSIIGKNNRDLTPIDFADMLETKIRLTLDNNKMEVFEYRLPIPGKGLRDFEARMVPSGPDEVTAIARDITDRKKSDVALKKKIEELQWMNHLMVDREVKMIDLKKEINALLISMGKNEKYVIHENIKT